MRREGGEGALEAVRGLVGGRKTTPPEIDTSETLADVSGVFQRSFTFSVVFPRCLSLFLWNFTGVLSGMFQRMFIVVSSGVQYSAPNNTHTAACRS